LEKCYVKASDRKQFGFCITNNDKKEYYFHAETEQEQLSWISAIQSSIPNPILPDLSYKSPELFREDRKPEEEPVKNEGYLSPQTVWRILSPGKKKQLKFALDEKIDPDQPSNSQDSNESSPAKKESNPPPPVLPSVSPATDTPSVSPLLADVTLDNNQKENPEQRTEANQIPSSH